MFLDGVKSARVAFLSAEIIAPAFARFWRKMKENSRAGEALSDV
jgi:hypothetical protein